MAKTIKKSAKKPVTKKVVSKKVEKKSTPKKVAKVIKPAKTVKIKEVKQKSTTKRGRPKKVKTDSLKHDNYVQEIPRPNKPAYSKEEMKYFKEMILEKREEIVLQLESLRDRMVDSNTGIYVNENSPYSLHMAELGTDAMEKEKNYLFTQREAKFLGYLDEALKRIDEGTFGYCIDCWAIIPKGRLEAVPHSQHCIICKNKFGK